MLLLALAACLTETAPAPPLLPASVDASRVVRPPLPPGPFKARLLLDAGHGAPRNPGNTNAEGESEADVTRRIADAVWQSLTVRRAAVARTRPSAELVDYPARLAMSAQHDLLVSIHTDSRAGTGAEWVDAQRGWWSTAGASGFAVLWSDEGPATLVERRHALATSVAVEMARAGFHPYDGVDYEGLYAGEATPGVFVDRHAARKRIMLLRRPVVPSILIETHEAHDLVELTAWKEPATWERFAGALDAAVRGWEVEGAAAGTPAPGR